MRESPPGVDALMNRWLQAAGLGMSIINYRIHNRSKGTGTMPRVHTQGIYSGRFVNARVNPDSGGNMNCWIVSIAAPANMEADELRRKLQSAESAVNEVRRDGDEQRFRDLYRILGGDLIDLERITHEIVRGAGFADLAEFRACLQSSGSAGRYVRRLNGGDRWDWLPPIKGWSISVPRVSAYLRAFIDGLSQDGRAALSLLGHITPLEDGTIRLPNTFPLDDAELDVFVHSCERQGILTDLGRNPNSVGERVWQLDHAELARALMLLDELFPSRVSFTEILAEEPAVATPEIVAPPPAPVPVAIRPPTMPPPPVDELPTIEQELARVTEEAENATARLDGVTKRRDELQRQIRSTTNELVELQRKLTTAQAEFDRTEAEHRALTEAAATLSERQRSLQTRKEQLHKQRAEELANDLEGLVQDEAKRRGVGLDAVLDLLRGRLRVR